MNAQWLSTVILVVFACTVIVLRMRGANKPTSSRKILIPPVGMSTGFLMFFDKQTWGDPKYFLIALLVGVGLSYPLMLTSKFHVVGDEIYLKRSKGFVLVLVGLLVLRLALHKYVAAYLSIPQTASCFFVLAFGMLVPWRIAMYSQYRRLKRMQLLHGDAVSQ